MFGFFLVSSPLGIFSVWPSTWLSSLMTRPKPIVVIVATNSLAASNPCPKEEDLKSYNSTTNSKIRSTDQAGTLLYNKREWHNKQFSMSPYTSASRIRFHIQLSLEQIYDNLQRFLQVPCHFLCPFLVRLSMRDLSLTLKSSNQNPGPLALEISTKDWSGNFSQMLKYLFLDGGLSHSSCYISLCLWPPWS